MKRLFCLLLCALLLTGCLPTPEVEVIPNKGEAIQKANEFVQTVTGSNEYSVCYCVPIVAHPDRQESSGDIPTATLPNQFSQWGIVLMRTFGGEYWSGVTVNAQDGTIIDKDKGY